MRAEVLGRGKPGVYNLAGSGELNVKQLADELGWYSVPVPDLAVGAAAEMISRLGFLPSRAQWISAFREPVIMSTTQARRELRWRPRHDALHTLQGNGRSHAPQRPGALGHPARALQPEGARTLERWPWHRPAPRTPG